MGGPICHTDPFMDTTNGKNTEKRIHFILNQGFSNFFTWYSWSKKKLGIYTTYICAADRRESTCWGLVILILNTESVWDNFRLQEGKNISHLSRFISFAERLYSQFILKCLWHGSSQSSRLNNCVTCLWMRMYGACGKHLWYPQG
jgi:hypothetical protein